MGVGGMDEMSRASAWRRFGVVVRVRRLAEAQYMLPSIARRASRASTIDETRALFVGLRRRGETQHGQRAAMLW